MSTASIVNELPPIPPMGKSALAQDNVKEEHPAHYKGFVAGVFSGIAKLTVGHPYASTDHFTGGRCANAL